MLALVFAFRRERSLRHQPVFPFKMVFGVFVQLLEQGRKIGIAGSVQRIQQFGELAMIVINRCVAYARHGRFFYECHVLPIQVTR